MCGELLEGEGREGGREGGREIGKEGGRESVREEGREGEVQTGERERERRNHLHLLLNVLQFLSRVLLHRLGLLHNFLVLS